MKLIEIKGNKTLPKITNRENYKSLITHNFKSNAFSLVNLLKIHCSIIFLFAIPGIFLCGKHPRKQKEKRNRSSNSGGRKTKEEAEEKGFRQQITTTMAFSFISSVLYNEALSPFPFNSFYPWDPVFNFQTPPTGK